MTKKVAVGLRRCNHSISDPENGQGQFKQQPKLSDFFTLHKGSGEAEKPFRAITSNRLNHQVACSIITCLVNP
jgi:hypothetical protein